MMNNSYDHLRDCGRKASVIVNEDFALLTVLSGFRMTIPDPDFDEIVIPADEISALKMGGALRDALNASRELDPKLLKQWVESGRFRAWMAESERKTMERYGYKTKKARWKFARVCHATERNGEIRLDPSHQSKICEFEPVERPDEQRVIVPSSVTDVALGEAIQLALSRCSSPWL